MLCLTQPTYEDAFYYLEKMKADGIKPAYNVYQALIRKCFAVEDKRWKLVKDEMEAVGYRVDEGTQSRLSRPGRFGDT